MIVSPFFRSLFFECTWELRNLIPHSLFHHYMTRRAADPLFVGIPRVHTRWFFSLFECQKSGTVCRFQFFHLSITCLQGERKYAFAELVHLPPNTNFIYRQVLREPIFLFCWEFFISFVFLITKRATWKPDKKDTLIIA